MSDFLQFVDRVPTLPNRKKLTFDDSSVKYAKVEWADEPITEGTFLNKGNFDKLNRILGYSKINGEYNQSTGNVEYEYPYFNSTNLIDNMRVLVQGGNSPQAPATELLVLNNSINTGLTFYDYLDSDFITLDNNDILILGEYSGGTYYKRFDKTGTYLSNASIGSSYSHPIYRKLGNGNIIIGSRSGNTGYYQIINQSCQNVYYSVVGSYNPVYSLATNGSKSLIVTFASPNIRGYIVDNSGTMTKTQFSIGSGQYPTAIELSNNKFLVAYASDNSGRYLNCAIVNDSGTIEYSHTSSTPSLIGFEYPKAVELDNGDIAFIGRSTNGLHFAVLDSTLANVKYSTTIGTDYYSGKITKLNNGNILIVYAEGTNTCVKIFNTNYELIKTTTTSQGRAIWAEVDADNMKNLSVKVIEMSNGNILLIGDQGNRLKYAIINQNGDYVKDEVLADITTSSTYSIELIDGNILTAGSTNQYSSLLKPSASSANALINNVELDTMLLKDKYYELVFNATQNKFIAEEVRNAN